MNVPAPTIDTPVLSLELSALAELATRRQWVCWRYDLRDGDWTKVPLQASGIKASSTNPHTWGALAAICQAALSGGYGVGYVFDGDVVGIDLDKCRNPKTGEIEAWAREIIERVDSYTEISPSGHGVHIICKGPIPRDGSKRGKVEVYTRGRYFTVSGRHLPGTPEDIRETHTALEWVWATFLSAAPLPSGDETFRTVTPGEFPWEKFDALMEADPKFRASWLHKRGDFDDQSSSVYDCSLLFLAAGVGWSDEELAALVFQHRKKWGGIEKAERRDYTSGLIAKVRRANRSRIEGAESTNAAMGRVLAEIRAEDVIEGGQAEALADLRARLRLPIARVIITGEKTAVAYSFVLADDRRVSLGDAGAVLDQGSFRRTIFAATGVVVPMAKRAVWDATVTVLQAAAEREEAADSDPVKELAFVTEEYQRNSECMAWEDEHGEEAFRDGLPVIRSGRLLLAIPHFQRWCQGKGHLLDLKAEGFRARLRLAGWTGRKITRRVKNTVVCRYYWSSEAITGVLQEKADETGT